MHFSRRLEILKSSFSYKNTIFFLFLSILLFFNFNDLSVRIIDINYWDEAQYIMFGRGLTRGEYPPFSWSPFTSFFFALLYLPFNSVGNWLPMVATLGRIIIYILLFLNLYLISKEIEIIPWAGAIFGMALVYPAMVSILKFQSDALFAVNSAFALWQVLRYRKKRAEKHIWLASLFCGFAALTRNDGLVLYIAFLFIIFFVIKNKNLKFWRKIVASVVPFVAIVIGYLAIYGMVTGSFEIGTKRRTWGAFRQGQYFIYGNDENCQTNQLHCAIERTYELYGTGEENDYSVFNAIKRNPQAYIERLQISLSKIPKMLFRGYGGRTSFSLLFLGLFGVFELLRTKNKEILIIIFSWMLYLPVYLITFYRQGYFYLPYYLFYILGMIGTFSILRLFQAKNSRTIISALLVGLFIIGLAFKLVSIYFTSFLLLIILWAGYWITLSGQEKESFTARLTPAILMLVGGILLHGNFDPMAFSQNKDKPLAEEEAIMVLFNEFPRESEVVAGAPGAVLSAQMQFVSVADFSAETAEKLYDELVSSGADAIYVDHILSSVNRHMWSLIEPEIGNFYERIYQGDNGSIQVLKVILP